MSIPNALSSEEVDGNRSGDAVGATRTSGLRSGMPFLPEPNAHTRCRFEILPTLQPPFSIPIHIGERYRPDD